MSRWRGRTISSAVSAFCIRCPVIAAVSSPQVVTPPETQLLFFSLGLPIDDVRQFPRILAQLPL